MPARIMARSVASSSLAGPMVATIFVRRFMSARLVTQRAWWTDVCEKRRHLR